jgi:dCTP deaminase
MSVLNKSQIEERLYSSNLAPDKQLVVTPILDKSNQITVTGIDVRLSNQFILFRPEDISHFKLKNLDKNVIRKFQRHLVVPFFKEFILHPNTLVLAATLEYLSMPNDLWALLEGRSSWARLGLIIATACSIDPGYKGVITLELSNLGKLPIHLYPGIRIGQLIFQETNGDVEYDSQKRKYYVQIGPEFSKINEDKEIGFFGKNY